MMSRLKFMLLNPRRYSLKLSKILLLIRMIHSTNNSVMQEGHLTKVIKTQPLTANKTKPKNRIVKSSKSYTAFNNKNLIVSSSSTKSLRVKAATLTDNKCKILQLWIRISITNTNRCSNNREEECNKYAMTWWNHHTSVSLQTKRTKIWLHNLKGVHPSLNTKPIKRKRRAKLSLILLIILPPGSNILLLEINNVILDNSNNIV